MEFTAAKAPLDRSGVGEGCEHAPLNGTDHVSLPGMGLASPTTEDVKQDDTPVFTHPLQDFPVRSNTYTSSTASTSMQDEITQKNINHILNAPPRITARLMKRMHNARCPRCYTRYSRPPPQWECTVCWQQDGNKIKVWQRDDESNVCMLCDSVIGRWSRHHCRCCGRLVCSKCCGKRAILPNMGFVDPQKVCDECVSLMVDNQ